MQIFSSAAGNLLPACLIVPITAVSHTNPPTCGATGSLSSADKR
jgi:hypothetical protein